MEQTIPLNTSNELFVNTDISKIFIWGNRFQKGQYINNSTYDPIVLKAGTILGRIHATNVLVPLVASASDGSQFPVGILAQDLTIAASATVTTTMVDYGDVAQDKIIFVKPGDGLETVVSSRRIKDHLQAQGIKVVPGGDEMTGFDNS